MNIDWNAVSKLSGTVAALGVLVWALNLWHEQTRYNAETDRMNTERMAAVITESLTASREDRRQLTELSKDMMAKLRANERAEKSILASLQEIVKLMKKDRSEVKSELQNIIEELEAQTRSVTRELNKRESSYSGASP